MTGRPQCRLYRFIFLIPRHTRAVLFSEQPHRPDHCQGSPLRSQREENWTCLGALLPVFGKQTLELTTWTRPILHLNHTIANFSLMLDDKKKKKVTSDEMGAGNELRLAPRHINLISHTSYRSTHTGRQAQIKHDSQLCIKQRYKKQGGNWDEVKYRGV